MASGKTFWARRHTDDRDKKDQEKAGYFRRDWLVYILLGGLFIAIIVKLSFIQIVEAAEIQAKRYLLASAYKGAVVPKRGSIIDAQGNVLASSIEVRELFLDPITTRDFLQSSRNTRGWTKEKIADTLAEKLNLSRDAIRADLDKDIRLCRSIWLC